jgi:hypothetical protein
MSGAPNSSSGRVVPRPFGQGRAFQHHGAGISAGHVEIGRVRARVDPDAIGGPAIAGAFVGLVPFHLDHAVINVELEMMDEPGPEFAEGQAVAHRNGAGADEAFPTGAERQALDRAAGGIGTVEHPDRLAMLGGSLEHVQQRRDEGVDTAAKVLQVDQDGVERTHGLAGGAAYLAIEAEYRDAVQRIGEVLGFDHIVLLVAAQAVLWTERCAELQAGCGERIQSVPQIRRNGGRMGQISDTLAFQRLAQGRVGQEAIETGLHSAVGGASSSTKQSGWWKSGAPGG